MGKYQRPPRKTLLEHPAKLEGERFGIDARPPEKILRYATLKLAECDITTKKAMQEAMTSDAGNRIAHDAAWLRGHCVTGIKLIEKLPAPLQADARKLWANAFHAGARHESITVNLRHLPDVQSADNRREGRRARKIVPKITVEKYVRARDSARGRKELYILLNATGPTVLAFENRHPDLVKGK